MTKLSGAEIAAAGLRGWALLVGNLRTRIATPDFAAGLALVNAIGAAAEEADHHPDLNLRYTAVDVRLTSHDTGGVTERDVRMAKRITALAAETGLSTDSGPVSELELGLDSPAYRGVLPFWRAVLALEDGRAEDELRDPAGVTPTVWFQKSGDGQLRQRWHPDVWVDPAQVRPRIDAAVAAGGSLVSDERAPSFWVLADPEGNRMCLCTWQDRSS